ncbi:hypothetical protein ERY430_41299 [Erythrobacter sp. EC-HK427]|nr:hypothetical protein ERY430_41299 [Erythrobacter sp. EC-HK427]
MGAQSEPKATTERKARPAGAAQPERSPGGANSTEDARPDGRA